MTVLAVDDLTVLFRTRGAPVRAVDSACFSMDQGETVAVVGESGSGKTSLALALMRLHRVPPCHYASGQVVLSHEGSSFDLLKLTEREMRRVRGGAMAMVFQDPMTSLNPVRSVGAQITEAVRLHRRHLGWDEARRETVRLLGEVGIANPERRARSFPHQLSGGMRQRVMIAMALACEPRVLVADEPTTALDVTVQAQIVELLQELQQRHGTAILLVTHDMGLVAQMAKRVIVMYAGRFVESADVEDIFSDQLMPYTWALLRSMPQAAPGRKAPMRPIEGQPPKLWDLPAGCHFAPRCPFVLPDCQIQRPPLVERRARHHAACLVEPERLALLQYQADHGPLPK